MDQETGENWTLRSLFASETIPPEIIDQVRARQLASVERLLGVIVMGNIISVWAVLQSFWGTGVDSLLTIWASTLGVLYLIVTFSLLRTRQNPIDFANEGQSRVDKISRVSLVLGVVWGVAPLIVIPSAEPMGQMALGIILVGLMFCGAILVGRIPQAAFSFVVPIAVFFVLSLQFNFDPRNGYLSVLTVVYIVFLAISIRWSHNQFIQQISNGEAVKQQSELIGLLLRDFEESTSDWLWQTDEEGVLVEVPMSTGAAKTEYGLMQCGRVLSDLFCESPALKLLRSAIKQHSDFRDLVLQVKNDETEIWWSVTGKPVYENGFFAGFRGVAADVTQSKETEDRVAYMAHYDGLTGLPNRATFHDALEKIVRRPAAADTQRAIVWLDLDKFKWVNDTLGHPAGDELLRVVAARIMRVADAEDIVARLGGDEFAMIIQRPAEIGELESFLQRMSKELSRTYDISGSTVNCSASLGVRLFSNDGTKSSTLMKHADLALHDAKEKGDGCWSLFEQHMEDKARERREIENDLRKAIDRSELRLHFQPLVDANTHDMVACETLLRWQHPERGLIFPGEFIAYAEDCGLINRLGDWVIDAAFQQAARLPADVRVGINISPLQIHSATLLTTLFNAAAKYEIDASRIELEITETVLMSNTEFTLERLHKLKEMGFRIALDDFGTGYSSLSYLRLFPFDKIKVDKCFVSDIETSEDSRKITIATLQLANSLGLRCTAEGVETPEQADFLRREGCDELQGYLFSRPVPIEDLSDFVEIKPAGTKRPTSACDDHSQTAARRA